MSTMDHIRWSAIGALAHIPEKWIRFSEKNMRQRMNLERIRFLMNRNAL